MNFSPILQRAAGPLSAFIAGAIFPLGFAPLDYTVVAPLAVGLLFLLWLPLNGLGAALLGFCFGLGAFAVGVSWVFVSLHTFGNMPIFLATLVVAVFVAIMACYTAACGFLQAGLRYLPTSVRMLLVMPACWVFLEWLRGWFLTGFPWLYLGYGQVDTPLAAMAPLAGVLSVSLLAAVAGAAIILVLAGKIREQLYAVGACFLVFGAGIFAGKLNFVEPAGDVVEVAVVQNNVALVDKWDTAKLDSIVNDYLEVSANEMDAQLIVWPEAALPMYLDQLSTLLLRQLVEHPADYLFGVVERQPGVDRERHYNTAVGISNNLMLYRKQQLVIFGEYLPLPSLFRWLLAYLEIPMSNFSSWPTNQPPMTLAGHRIGVSICYEDAFQRQIRSSLPESTLLANISEDAWFGDSLAPWQRLQIARTRALENGRPLVRANNNGLSALIDHRARVVALAPQFRAHVLRGKLQPVQGATPFVRFGNLPLLVLLMLLLLGSYFTQWIRRTYAAEERLH